MRRENHPVWLEGETNDVLIRRDNAGDYVVVPAMCSSERLAELGKAIIDALVHTKEGVHLLDFAVAVASEKSVAAIAAGPPEEDD